MKKLLDEWKENSREREDENFLFLRSLKIKDELSVDNFSKQIHKETFDEIDCLQCGNCCKNSKPYLDDEDIQNISNYLSKSVQFIKDKYIEIDEENEWSFNALPCPFLESNNSCKIYEVRPKDCREFPHTNKPNFSSRSYQTSRITTICPAAFKIVERMKNEF